jgi:flagellar hook assembly protein FlgD
VVIGLTGADAGEARVTVFDLSGRVVAELDPVSAQGQSATVTWDGRASSGEPAAAGVYLARVSTTGGESVLLRLVHTR